MLPLLQSFYRHWKRDDEAGDIDRYISCKYRLQYVQIQRSNADALPTQWFAHLRPELHHFKAMR